MKKALFLDRDGVINFDYGYVHKIKDFDFLPDIFDLIKLANELDYITIVVTNQSGIGRGYYSTNDFIKLMDWVKERFIYHGCSLDDIFYCPYHEEEGIGKYKACSFDRKPFPGMIYKAQKKYDLNLRESILIGDKMSDIEAGLTACVGTNILISKVVSKINRKYLACENLKMIIDILRNNKVR